MRRCSVEALLLALLLAPRLSLAAAPAHTPAEAPAPAQAQTQLLEVWLNGESVDAFAPLLLDQGQWYAPASALQRWRLRPSDAPRLWHGEAHHGLQAWRPQLDSVNQRLVLQADPRDFHLQQLRLDQSVSAAAPLIEPLPGAALDYHLHTERHGSHSSSAALMDLRAFGWNSGSLLRSSGVLRLGDTPQGLPQWQRLDSAWQHNDPEGLWRASVGDSISCGGELAPALRFAGLQFGTDFGLRPDLVTQPQPSVSGSAQVPSGVDLLIDDRSVGSAQVGPGGYTLDRLPSVTGAGEIRVVQRDVLGVERVQLVPYYSSPRLLRQGLQEHCVEAGVLRRGYASSADHYQGTFVAGALRRGISDQLTLMARAEAGASVRAVHLGAHWVLAQAGVLSLQAAHSQADATGSGARAAVGFERVARQGSLSASFEAAERDFRQLDGGRAPLRRAALFGGSAIGRTSVSGSLIWQRSATQRSTRVATVSLQRRLGAHWHAGLSVYHRESQLNAALLLTRAIGSDTTVAARLQSGESHGVAVQAQRSEAPAGGVGWRLQAGNEQLRGLAGVSWLGEHGRAEVEAAQWQGDADARLRASLQGGVLWLGGRPLLGRTLGDSSAARVEIEGMAGVGVRLNHRDTAITDARGHAWVWGLQPWQDNTLGLAADVLPLDVVLGVPEMRVRPPAQTVVRVRFDARRTRSALLVVQHPDGSPVAAGARAYAIESGAGADHLGAPFANGGQVWLSDLQAHNQLLVDSPQGRCRLSFSLPDGPDPAAPLGPYTCTP